MASNDPSSDLISLPTDQLQQILSFVTIHEFLALSQTSKSIHNMIDLAHHLCYQGSDYDQKMGRINRNKGHADLRRSMPNIANMDPISSHEFEKRAVHHRSDLTVTKLTHCLNRFHYLRTLQLYRMEHIGDKFLPILNAAPTKFYLTHLKLHNVRIVKDAYTLNLPDDRLSHVELDGVIFCTYKVLKSFTTSRNLQVLNMSGCRALKDADVHDIIRRQNEFQKLRELVLENCSTIVAPNIACHTLIRLSLARCNMLRDLSLISCTNLVHVDLSYCSLITDSTFKALIRQNANIQKLSLKGVRGVASIDLRSDCLQELDLSMCIGLKDCNIDCRAMVMLEMGMCVKLDRLNLTLSSIQMLDLSMLSMRQIAINARKLKTLNFSGCCKLTSIEEFSCPALELLDISGTNLCRKDFYLSKKAKTKIRTGGEVHDWTNPFTSL
jgi:uncharacterized protein YjbI with pentapeptide repeats